VRLLPDVVNWPGFAAGLLFRRLCRRTTDSQVFSYGGFLQMRLPEFAAGILDGILGALSEAFCCGLAAVYQKGARPRGHGNGRREKMAMIGAFSRAYAGTFLTRVVGSLLGSVIRDCLIVALYLGGESEWQSARAAWDWGRSANLRWAIAEAIPVAAGTFLGIGALAIRVWETADCGLLA